MYDPLVVDTFITIYPELTRALDHLEPQKDSLSAITRGLSPSSKPNSPQVRLDEINASTEEMLVLYELARGLSGRIRFADAADIIAKHLRRLVPASTCVFFLYDEQNDDIVVRSASGEHAAHFSDLRIPRGQRLSGWVAANRLSVLNSDPVLDLGEAARSMRPPLRSCLSTPLISGSDLVGVLTAYSTLREGFTENHQRILEAVAGQVGHTLRDSMFLERQESERLQPHVSAPPDFKQVENVIASELGTQAFHEGFALIHLDIRSGGRGNVTTDAIALPVLEAVRKELRPADMLFRSGDRTLLALLPSTDTPLAMELAGRIRDRLRTLGSLAGPGISVVVGVAAAPADGMGLSHLIETANRRATTVEVGNRPPSVH